MRDRLPEVRTLSPPEEDNVERVLDTQTHLRTGTSLLVSAASHPILNCKMKRSIYCVASSDDNGNTEYTNASKTDAVRPS